MSGQKTDPEGSTKPEHATTAEDAILEARRAKAKRLRERGENPFANDVVPRLGGETKDVKDLRAIAAGALEAGKYATDKVEAAASGRLFHVRGRCVTHRSAGGLTFLRLRDRTGELQLLMSEEKMGAGYTLLDDLDVGDIIEAEGTLTASKRGELSLEPKRFRILTKSARPLPEKWHGLTDVETRYRQRYVDLIANPGVQGAFRARSVILSSLRHVFEEHGFLEVETPTMHTVIGGAAAKPFLTHHNTLDMELYLRIAPELYLKRLLVGGLERVFEIGRCYRNEGISTRHNPEFTMLEFYWSYVTYRELLDFTELLLRKVDEAIATALPEAHATWSKERPFTIAEPFVRMPMNDAVAAAAKKTQIPAWQDAIANGGGMGLVHLLHPEFVDHIKEWSKCSPRAKAIDWSNCRKGLGKCENDGERLFALYEYLVEPFLAEDYRSQDGTKSLPVFVTDYPYETSPLARKNDARPDLVDRFELFIHGRELCNAFSELNDPEDQAARFRDQVDKKAAGAEETMDYDADYIRALEYGMPPAAGFGMGIDRLAMMLTNQPSIRDVILFPLMRETLR